MSTEIKNPDVPRRKALKVAVSALCSEVGFTHAEDDVLETLTEMMQSYLTEAGRSTKAFCELSGRTEPMTSDVLMSLSEMGADVMSLQHYSKRPNKMILMPPLPSNQLPQLKTLQAGEKKKHPSHIPDYLPSFPDPHSYIRSSTHKPPSTEYQLIREKAASQKRDVECALTKFIAKTGETETLFADDPYAYPLIANKPKPLPYIDALLPKEEDLDKEDQVESGPGERKSQQTDQQKQDKSSQKIEEDSRQTNISSSGAVQNSSGNGPADGQQQVQEQVPAAGQVKQGEAVPQQNQLPEGAQDSDSQIDNPYLRAIKMPKLKATGKKTFYSGGGTFKW